MRRAIRPDVHARFLALLARVDAQVKTEQQAERRSAALLVRAARQHDRTGDGDRNTA